MLHFFYFGLHLFALPPAADAANLDNLIVEEAHMVEAEAEVVVAAVVEVAAAEVVEGVVEEVVRAIYYEYF